MNFSKRLVEERKRLKIKQKEMAEKVGVQINSQLDYEKGRVPAFVAYLEQIAEMGVDVQYLLTGQRSGEPVLKPEEKAVLAAWKNATKEIQMAALAVLATGQCGLGGVNVGGDNNGVIATNGGTIGKIKSWKK